MAIRDFEPNLDAAMLGEYPTSTTTATSTLNENAMTSPYPANVRTLSDAQRMALNPQTTSGGLLVGMTDVGKDLESFIAAISSPWARSRLLATEAEDRPLWTQLGLKDFEQQLFGMEGQAGGIELLGRLTQQMGEIERSQLDRQRTADVAAVEKLGGRAIEALRASDPQRAALMEQQRMMTEQLYASAQGLTPQEERLAVQQARAGSMARGRGYDASSIAGELMGRDEFRGMKRAEAQQSGSMLFNMYQQTGGDPFQAILGRPSGIMGMAQGQQGVQAGMLGQAMGPNLYDPNVGLNIGAMDRANQMNYNAAIQGARMAQQGASRGGAMSMFGSVLGAMIPLLAACWVAREVYGTKDGRWELFRLWLFTLAPKWFYELYLKHGEQFAAWVKDKPMLKWMIRKWMDGRIATVMAESKQEI
jgi:hypothetical protein